MAILAMNEKLQTECYLGIYLITINNFNKN